MKLTAALAAATILGIAAPAAAADLHHGHRGGHGWRHPGHHGGHPHARHHGRFYAEEPVEVVEYREPYLPRGVLYNAPPLPLPHAYTRGYRDVISAKY